MQNALKRKDVSKHRQDPGYSVEVWNEPDAVKVIEQDRIVEGLHVSKLG